MAILDVEPVHPGRADGLGVLQRGHASHVVDKAVDQQIDLHPAQARHVVVLVCDAFLQRRRIHTQLLLPASAISFSICRTSD